MLNIVFTLFNLQGTDALSATQEASGLYHAQFRLSRTFFKFFRGDSPCCCFRGNSVILAWMLPFVKNFFPFSPKFLHLSLPAAALADSLRILSYAVPFVKRFLPDFRADFSDPLDEVFYP